MRHVIAAAVNGRGGGSARDREGGFAVRQVLGLRVLVLAGVAAVALGWSGVAHAGVALMPASGSTTSSTPTFEVYLAPEEQSLAEVYVATDGAMDSNFFPVHMVGSCQPFTPTTTENHFTCQPSSYSNGNFGPSLPPGTYSWWMTFWQTDPTTFVTSLHISGPLVFTVPQPVAPDNTYLVSPADGGVVSATPQVTIYAPASATLSFYVSDSNQRLADGSPAGSTETSCAGTTSDAGSYFCKVDPGILTPGSTYFWWVVVTVNGSSWVYGPRAFVVVTPPSSSPPPPPAGGGGGGGGTLTRTDRDAPNLPSSSRYSGRSIKDVRLSNAAYQLTKFLGLPKTIAVGCWSNTDWPSVSGDNGDGIYSTLGFYDPLMPHWVQLSPRVCGSFETLLYHRPLYPNRFTANAVETLTHEMMHALGVRGHADSEAKAECFGMQLSILMALELKLPTHYSARLARLTLENYSSRPARYRSPSLCREGGAWDLFPTRPSPPWHDFGV